MVVLNLRKGCAHYECGGVRVDLIFICVINKFMCVVVKATSARRQQMGADGFFFWVFCWWYTHYTYTYVWWYGACKCICICMYCIYALGAKKALNCLLCVYMYLQFTSFLWYGTQQFIMWILLRFYSHKWTAHILNTLMLTSRNDIKKYKINCTVEHIYTWY